MSYFFSISELTNDVHLITQHDIRKMIEVNEKDRIECYEVTSSSHKGENYYGASGDLRVGLFAEMLYRDAKTDGFMMEMPYGIIIKQAERNHYYRGENQLYTSSLPSLNRELNTIFDEECRQLYKLVSDMRIHEFKNFLFDFKHVQFWQENYGDVLFDLLAQHYGLQTHWLDITNDFMCALFFATCYYDNHNKKWHPLTREQTEKNENTKYGMIFHIPQWRVQADLSMQYATSQDAPYKVNAIFPIGFQPFMRCHMQYGYGIFMPEDSPLQSDISFEKLMFRHDENWSEEIFNIMKKGELIYPHEGLISLNDIIEQIMTATDFTKDSFEYAFQNNTYFNDKKHCRLLLEQYEVNNIKIKIGNNHPYFLSRQRRRRIDRIYERFSLEKNYNITPTTRLVYTPND